jgi:hypothetical protein
MLINYNDVRRDYLRGSRRPVIIKK